MIPNLPRAGTECGHLANAAPAPQCPVSVASRIHALGEMNHLLLWPGQQLIVYVKATLLGRSLLPHPSYAVISAQQQPLGSTSGHSWGPESSAQRRIEGRLVFRALWQLSSPLSGRAQCQRRKWGCEGSPCFCGTNKHRASEVVFGICVIWGLTSCP